MPVAGISVLGLGIGLAVSACGPATSSAAAGTGGTKTAASTPAAPASSAPASNASTGTVAPSSAPTATQSPAPAATPAPAVANVTPVDASADGKPFVVWDCNSRPQVEPASFVLTCADYGIGWTNVHWTKWAPQDAAGTGILSMNDCVPDCADGKFQDYPADISLTGSYLPAQNEPFSYTKVTFAFTTTARPTIYATVNGKVKPTHPATWTLDLPPFHPAGG